MLSNIIGQQTKGKSTISPNCFGNFFYAGNEMRDNPKFVYPSKFDQKANFVYNDLYAIGLGARFKKQKFH